MSLDNIQLPTSIIQNLYSKSLYHIRNAKPVSDNALTEKISFLGTNQKKIAIVVAATESIYLPDDELNFLLGILSACKLSMADIALINISKNPAFSYTDIQEQLQAEKILLFGLPADSLNLPLQFPPYQVQQFNNQVYLSSASLDALQKNKAEKMNLWNSLKSIFSLN